MQGEFNIRPRPIAMELTSQIAPSRSDTVSSLLRYSWSWQRCRAVLRLEHPVLTGLQELETDHPTDGLEVFLDPNHAHQRDETFRTCQFEGRSNLDLPFRREASSTTAYVHGLDVIFKVVAKLIAACNFKPDFQMYTL